jgi:flagellin
VNGAPKNKNPFGKDAKKSRTLNAESSKHENENNIKEDKIMSLTIQNNIAAMDAHRQLQISDAGLTQSLERLSSGYRINKAADDAAGLSISMQMNADIASYNMASQNAAEATSLLQVAEGATDQISNMLTRLKELATEASSSNNSGNLDKINAEGNQLIDEIDRIANVTQYSGTNLLDGTFGVSVSGGTMTAGVGLTKATGLQSATTYNVVVATNGSNFNITVSATLGGQQVSQTLDNVAAPGSGQTSDVNFAALGLTLTLNDNLTNSAAETITSTTATASNFQIGAQNNSDNRIGILLGNVQATSANGLDLSKDQLLSATNAQTFLDSVDSAISTLADRRGDIGAAQNRLGYASANLSTTIENVQSAESTIRDVDMASEMTTFTKNQILLQAGTAMLAQANAAPQTLLSLFK